MHKWHSAEHGDPKIPLIQSFHSFWVPNLPASACFLSHSSPDSVTNCCWLDLEILEGGRLMVLQLFSLNLHGAAVLQKSGGEISEYLTFGWAVGCQLCGCTPTTAAPFCLGHQGCETIPPAAALFVVRAQGMAGSGWNFALWGSWCLGSSLKACNLPWNFWI